MNQLIFQLGEKGKPATEAHLALIEMGEASVPRDWEPKEYKTDIEIQSIGGSLLTELTNRHMKDPVTILGNAYIGPPYTRTYLKITSRYRFNGSGEHPVEYAPGFYLWDGAVILDNVDGFGVLITNETKVKHVEIINGRSVERLGAVRNWGFDFSQK